MIPSTKQKRKRKSQPDSCIEAKGFPQSAIVAVVFSWRLHLGGQGVNIGMRPYLKGEPCVTEDWSPTAVFIVDWAGCSAPLNLSYFPRRDLFFFFLDHFGKARVCHTVRT